jgi:hypothetical protein
MRSHIISSWPRILATLSDSSRLPQRLDRSSQRLSSLASATVSLASATESLAPTWPLEIYGMDRGRLFLSRMLLEEHKATPLIAKKLSELQAGAVAAMVASATLSAAEQVELATMAVAVPWASEADVSRVLAAFTVESPLPPGKRRRSQQDYTMVHHFLTTGMWDAMMDPSTPADIKLTALLGHLVKLGMRCPTEPTVKWITSLWLVCSTDPVELGRMSVIDKAVKLKNVKVHFDGIRRRAADPPEWVGVLPSKPVEFLRDYQLLYKGAFPGEASPAPPGVNVEIVAGLDMSYSCRGGMRTSQLSLISSSAPSSGASSSMATDVQNILLSFVKSMQANQQQMMQIMVQPQANTRTLNSLAAIEDRGYRQQLLGGPGDGLMGFGPPAHSRSRPLFEELPDSPPAKAAAPAATLVAAPNADETSNLVPTQAEGDQVAPGGSSHEVVAKGIDQLFGMLQNRKQEAKLQAQEAKAAKAQEAKTAKAPELLAVKDKAAGVAPPLAPNPAKGKGRGKAAPPAPNPAKGKGRGKAAKVMVPAPKLAKEAEMKPPAVADPNSLSDVNKAKLAKARLNAQNGKDRKLTPEDGWGCAKCRWRIPGCSQCKSKTFAGFVWNPSMKL